ncbi:peptidoglycan-binding domain-containing protein [Treponema zioleckii]|uniref:peptidoglycan-binding domain-containing protein n=1 Tax=Treponema zioleckii TaxID=331680 RepID=UPI00168B0A9D|nr:peptidoglycan-binding domain-containing protein [Treponema zioleckii]
MRKISIIAITLLVLNSLLFAQNYTRKLSLQKQRMNGNDVVELQKKLISLGFTEIGEADGWFGPKTETGVKKYQHLYGFEENGVFDGTVFDCLYNKNPLKLKYDSAVKKINSIKFKKLTAKTKDYSGHSTEGGNLTAYIDGRVPIYYQADFYGESGQVHYFLYALSEKEEIFIQEYHYYTQMYSPDTATITTAIYYLTENKTYKIENGNFMKTSLNNDYDSLISDMKSLGYYGQY